MKNLFKMLAVAMMLALSACGGSEPSGEEQKVTPTVQKTSVAEGAKDVPVSVGNITVRWSVPVEIADEAGIKMSGDIATSVSVQDRMLTVSFGELGYSTKYVLSIDKGAIVNKSDGKEADKFSLSFTTERNVLTTNPDISVDVVFEIDEQLCNPNANAETKALYDYLRNEVWTKKTLSGSMGSTVVAESDEWVHNKTGKHTAISCFDFMNVNRWDKYQSWDKPYSELVTNAEQWHNDGGIVACMWHWRDPSGETDEFYCKQEDGKPYTTFDASKIFDKSSTEYRKMIEEIDLVAGYLKQLQERGIPVIWRPLHEAEGNRDEWGGAWFWWGNGSGDRAAACMELWRVMYDRMTNDHLLNNLIWVWTNQITGVPLWYDDGKMWYPGNEYVDLMSIDIYDETTAAGRGSHISQFRKCAHVADCRKMVALAECGYIPDAEQMHENGDIWLYYMPWNGDFTTDAKYNGEYWATSFDDADILTRDEVSYQK